jgi:hypothetical protein
MGRVLLARDTVLGREVALKILRDDLGLTPEMKTQLVDRMRQEARTVASTWSSSAFWDPRYANGSSTKGPSPRGPSPSWRARSGRH